MGADYSDRVGEECMETENKNIHVIEVDMQDRPLADIARDAALQIAALFDHLVEEQKKKDVE